MSKPTHTPTPGPWTTMQGHDGDPTRWIVVQAAEPNYIIAVIENGAPGDFLDTEEANAKLFTAAPDMLEALECTEDAKRHHIGNYEEIEERWAPKYTQIFPGKGPLYSATDLSVLARELRRRAIAKAKGEAE